MDDDETTIPLSRRAALGSLLGLGLLSGPAQAEHKGVHWKKDVDADGNRLSDLRSLAMTDDPTEIRDFAGENLSISNNGVLNAANTSPWDDSDNNDLLETPNHDGVDVEETQTNKLSVGTGASVTGIWGNSGEKVPLGSAYKEAGFHVTNTTYENLKETALFPFGSFSFTNIENIHISLVSFLAEIDEGETLFVRLNDRTNNSPISDTEIQVSEESNAFEGPKALFNATDTRVIGFQGKVSGGEARFHSPVIYVWGEIA